MRRTQRLSSLLKGLVDLIEEEAGRNPAFADRLEGLLSTLPGAGAAQRSAGGRSKARPAPPDVMAIFEAKGAEEFRFWLRTLDIQTLKEIIRVNGFDAAKASSKWTNPDKFIELIAQQTPARLRRGSAFLPPRGDAKPSQE